MADKRISQLIERVDIANNDVLPIVASGATTTNKVTISTIQDWMQSNLDVGVTSVGLTMPSAFQVSGSPITTSGNITVTATGTASQYIRGDGSLADFPQGGGGGGASVSYYLNGSVSQGTIGGVAYQELSKTPILGAGTDFNISADGYIASFITDAGDPALLEIPAGNWNFETYLQASSGGGTPSFYIELYKVSGSTATLIASNSGSPELIAFGTVINPYFSALAVPQTTLALTDRLAIRYYVTHSGRTITLHTENNTLCQIITTFTTGLTALNGLTAQVQNFATGTSGTDFNISSTGSIHTFNLPDASASNRGAVTTGTQTFAGYKIFNGTIGVNNDIQLATQGTALNTFIKNINSTGLTSIGSNGFGFNNANNIYFSGSNKGGGVFAFSNTGTQIYTLPNASGTISLTSDLGAYLPLSGGTMTGAINGISANFTSNLSSDSGVYSNTAFFAKHNPGSTVTVNGWNAMQGDANTFIVLNSTKGMRINFPSNASFTHTLPDASGTIALTSNLSSYLPLSGGTLTGALNGTSASFSGALTADSTDGGTIFVRTAGSNVGLLTTTFQISGSGSKNDLNAFVYGSNDFGVWTNSSKRLTIAGATGAATFSSSVTSSLGSAGANFNSNAATTGSVNAYRASNSVGIGSYGIEANVGNELMLGGIANATLLQSVSNTPLQFGTNQTARMTITASGNVGIGTASPSAKLHIDSPTSGGSGEEMLRITRNTAGQGIRLMNYDGGTGIDGFTLKTLSNTNLLHFRMDGNIGIGTASPAYKLAVEDSGSLTRILIDNTSNASAGAGLWMRTLSGGTMVSNATVRTDNAGNFQIFTGTTSDAERMRITAGGNVGIGTTSPANKLEVTVSSNQTNLYVDDSYPLKITNTSTTNNSYVGMYLGSGNGIGATIQAVYPNASVNTEANLLFSTRNSAGSLAERMRITSGGYLKASPIGTYNSGAIHEFYQSVNGAGATVITHAGASDPYGLEVNFPSHDPNNAINYMFGAYKTSGGFTWIYRIFSNGTVSARSDARWKKNIETTRDGYIDDLCKLRVVKYNWYNHEDDAPKELGLIAQEVEEVFPGLVQQDPVIAKREVEQEDGTIIEEEYEDGVSRSVKTSVLPFMLLKAMQEQQEQIKELRAEIEALKSQING